MNKTIKLNDSSQLAHKQLKISWPGHEMTINLTQSIHRLGRFEQGNDIIVGVPVISRYHAMLQWDGSSYVIIDGQSINGQHQPSSNGLYVAGERVSRYRLSNGDVIRIPGQNENFIVLTYIDPLAPVNHEIKRVALTHKIHIGRGQQNELPLPDPLVSSTHASVMPVAGGHMLQDLNSSNGTFVNGQRIQETTLQPGDIIQVGSIRLQYTGHELVSADLSQSGIRVDALNLRKRVKFNKSQPSDPDFKILIHDVSLSIQPHEFVAIVGGSGTGKSTLLDALNGFRPAEGTVLINGDHLYDNFDAYRRSIGYVPQEDIIHRELTVSEALRYVAKLRLPPDTQEAEIEQRIDDALEQMAMSERKNVLIAHLSGGQRKRVSIAVELIADPGIIFLDEPTSGLDPGLDKKMMFTLRQVANSGKTVILVTHATGNIIECHLVAFLAVGGRLVFFGPPNEALRFFGVSDFAEIYNLVELEPDRWIQTYHHSPYYNRYIAQRLAASASTAQQQGNATEVQESVATKIQTMFRQMGILTQRYTTLLVRDRRNLLFLLLQAPIIGILLLLVTNWGLFAKGFDTQPEDVSDIQKILFVMACSATWFGLINSAREIVKEMPIYRRERLVNLSIPAYISSKLIVLLGLSFLQALALVLVVAIGAQFEWEGSTILTAPVEIFITIALVTFTSACFGLFLSTVAGREDRVMSLMPLFLIPQIVFAGVVFKLTGITKAISYLIFTRWGIEALGSTVNLPSLHEAASFSAPIADLAFEFAHTSTYVLQTWLVLILFAILSVGLAIAALKRQDVV